MSVNEVKALKKYVAAANYLSAIQIFLKNNFLLDEPLMPEHIKPVLLGHWGTCPGINFAYAHLNNLIKKHNLDMMFILGPGHGFPALQANLFIEGTLEKFYPSAKHDSSGVRHIAKNFSWPYGFPSHSNPGTPGVILEGGELGYSLSTAYGAVLDNPNLIVSCLIGDGEAETAALATSWHLNKIVNPKTNGMVLPILHLNGYKISGPTFFGRMSDKELTDLFSGYGYYPIIVESSDETKLHEKMIAALETSYNLIKKLKSKSTIKPKQPMIILKTLKGWTGIKTLNGKKIEGNHLSHQVVVKNAKKNKNELQELESWLRSYNFQELFSNKKGFIPEINSIIPKNKMGSNKHTFPDYKPLKLPKISKFIEKTEYKGQIGSSNMRRAGAYLNEVFKLNKNNKNFRLMSPDETYSNKLDEVFKSTKRSFQWPLKPWDKDISNDGRVMEMLSEHSLQGLSQGYVLTGRHSIFASYAAFIDIVSSMVDQYDKFIRISSEIPWRKPIPSLNYILTSSGWRQQHNGFSHQNPSFISGVLEKPGCFSRVYFPADGTSTLAVIKKSLESKNRINLIVAGKTVEPRWLTVKEAEDQLKTGIGVWDFASDKNPDIIFMGIGDYMTKECLAAIDILKNDTDIKIRFVNVMEITSLGIGSQDCKIPIDLNKYCTKDKPIIINYHGYVRDIKAILGNRSDPDRFVVHGYEESGSTTTPFDMHVRNNTDRYTLAINALELLSGKAISKSKAQSLITRHRTKLRDHKKYICKYGDDPEDIKYWKWKNLDRKKIEHKKGDKK